MRTRGDRCFARSRTGLLFGVARHFEWRRQGDVARGFWRGVHRPNRGRTVGRAIARPTRRLARNAEGEDVNKFVQPALDAYNLDAIRADFPILAERPYGKPLVYLDNAASAQKPKKVIDRVTYT